MLLLLVCFLFFFQAEDGIRDLVRSRGLGDVYKRQATHSPATVLSHAGARGKRQRSPALAAPVPDLSRVACGPRRRRCVLSRARALHVAGGAARAARQEDLATPGAVSYTHLRAHETVLDLVCRLLLEKQKQQQHNTIIPELTRHAA